MAKRQSTVQVARLSGARRGRKPLTVALSVDANRWILEEARSRGWRLMHFWYSENRIPAGVILNGALIKQLPDDPLVRQLLKGGCSVVRLGDLPHPDDALVPAVLPDHKAEGCVAAEHFFDRGFRDVGYFGRDPWSDSQQFFEGFRDRAESLDMICHLCRFRAESSESQDTKNARKKNEFISWLKEMPKPFGLLAPGDAIAAINCYLTTQAGLSVPDDVAILSRGDRLDICESSMPTISSCDQDDERRVRAACDLLDRMMQGESGPAVPIMIPPKGVVERESTNVLATPDRVVAEALRFMWDHLDADFAVELVAQQVGVSSRQLARRFQKALNRTVTAELRRKRLEQAKRLLRSTDLLIADISVMVGFLSNTYLHQAFRAAFGITPAKYRRKEKGI